jgi:hypothetical protein
MLHVGMKTVEKDRTQNHKCRKTVGTGRDFFYIYESKLLHANEE